MNAAPGWIIGISFFGAAVFLALQKQWRAGLLYFAVSAIAFSILYGGGSVDILLESMSLSLIFIFGVGLSTKRCQLIMEKCGIGGGMWELGIFLMILAIVGAVCIIVSALG